MTEQMMTLSSPNFRHQESKLSRRQFNPGLRQRTLRHHPWMGLSH